MEVFAVYKENATLGRRIACACDAARSAGVSLLMSILAQFWATDGKVLKITLLGSILAPFWATNGKVLKMTLLRSMLAPV